MFVDSHCHLDGYSDDELEDLIKRAYDNGVGKLIVNGYNRNSNKKVIELVKKFDIVYGAIGWHPGEIDEFTLDDLKFLEEHINDDKIVAIGEIGLDYHYDSCNKNKQIDIFKRQLDIAIQYHKPVIIHSRDSIQDTYNILKEKKARGVIHCYSGSIEMAREFIKIGFYLGIGGICTFKNANNIIEVIKGIPLEYIVLETDSPFLTPEPYRGKRNEPMYIPIIAKKVADVKSVDFKEVMLVTSSVVGRIFDKLS